MSIRSKSVLFTAINVVTLMTVVTLLASKTFLSNYDELEISQSMAHMDRLKSSVDQQAQYLSAKILDWSQWDDTYTFLSDHNNEYIKSNLEFSTLVNLRIDMMAFVDKKSQVIRSIVQSLEPDGTVPSENAIVSFATSSALLTNLKDKTGNVSGVVVIDGLPLLIAAQSVLVSSGTGDPNGYLVFGRVISKSYAQELGAGLKIPLEIQVIPKSGELFTHIQKEYEGKKDVAVTPENDNEIEASRIFKDIFGNKAVYAHALLPRTLHEQGISLVRYLIGLGILLSVILIGILWIVIDRLILHRVVRLRKDITSLDIASNKTMLLSGDTGTDEISELIRVMNHMFRSLTHSQYLLKDQQMKTQQYFDNAAVMIVVISSDQTVLNVNRKLKEILEYSEDELIGKNWFSIIHDPVEVPAFQQSFKRLISSQEERFLGYEESNVISKSGSKKRIGWHTSLLKNEQGEVVAVLRSGEDVTIKFEQEAAIARKNEELETTKQAVLNILDDQKILEEQIKVERDRATMIVSTMSEGLFVVDTQKQITLVNTAACSMMGFTQKEVIGKKLSNFTTVYKLGVKVPEDQQPLNRTIEKGESLILSLEDEQYIEGKNGKIPVAISTSPLRQGDQITGALVTFHDISKDKLVKQTIEKEVTQRTQDLHDERAKLIASINSLSMGYLLMDTTGKPLMANSLISRILDSSNTIMTIEDISTMLGESLDLINRFKNCVSDKKVVKESGVNFRGKILKISLIPVVVIVNGEDKTLGAVLLIEDITERKVMERSKDEFFSIASHELRTPLTAIRGNTSMILDFYGDKIPDKDMKEMIEDIHASSIRLIDIVNDFLNVSRLEQGKIDFKNTTFDLRDLARESVQEFEGSALEKHVAVRYEDSGEELPKVFADRDRAKQAMLNLVGNSLKFTESGEVVVRIIKDGEMLRCRVNDNGRGIPKDNQALLFRKFQQAGSSLFTRDTTKGTGLGLYISRLIIEGMGGRIWLEKSEEGVGSEFCFTLPVVK